VKDQKKRIFKFDWDVLIVLDACRYDVFENNYGKYLSGNLEKMKSRGSETVEWFKNTWNEERDLDISYYSANPWINGNGVPDADIVPEKVFNKIYNIWEKGWDENKGTVYPHKFMELYDGRTPAILHFIQPHEPYLSIDYHNGITWDNEPLASNDYLKKLRDYGFNLTRKVIGHSNAWRLARIIYNGNVSRMEEIIKKDGYPSLINAYRYNLERSLKTISMMFDETFLKNNEVIVTADHGECLGEYEIFGHPENLNFPVLTHVPWFKVRGVKNE